MRRLLILTVLVGLLLSVGCGPGNKVAEPTSVPPRPKGPPAAHQGPGGDQGKKPVAAPHLNP